MLLSTHPGDGLCSFELVMVGFPNFWKLLFLVIFVETCTRSSLSLTRFWWTFFTSLENYFKSLHATLNPPGGRFMLVWACFGGFSHFFENCSSSSSLEKNSFESLRDVFNPSNSWFMSTWSPLCFLLKITWKPILSVFLKSLVFVVSSKKKISFLCWSSH